MTVARECNSNQALYSFKHNHSGEGNMIITPGCRDQTNFIQNYRHAVYNVEGIVQLILAIYPIHTCSARR